MIYNFDQIISREGTSAIKEDKAFIKSYLGKEVNDYTLFMWVADMDFSCSPQIIEAIKNRADQKIFGYTIHVNEDYFNAIINWFKARHNWSINKKHIVYSSGTVEALKNLVLSLTNKGDGIVIQTPVYTPFSTVIVENNRNKIINQLIYSNNSYQIDFDDLESKLKIANTKMMIFCSPHNPVGRVWNKIELNKVSELCEKYNVILVADEIHGDLTRTNINHYPLATITDYNNLISCTAINKTFNTAGLHCTNIIIKNKELREKFVKISGYKSPSPFALEALKAAYNNSDEWLKELKIYLDKNFEYLEDYLKENLPKIKLVKSEGTYLAWLDFKAYNLSSMELDYKFFNESNILIQTGDIFGDGGEGFVRINIACPLSKLKIALERIQKTFK